MSNETQMQEATKRCPFCGEEILAVAQKCKHCGEFLNAEGRNNNAPIDKIDSLDVSEDWKKRFRTIEKYYNVGAWFVFPNANFKLLPFGQKLSVALSLYTFGMWFGPFAYLKKGMWLKGLLFTALIFASGVGYVWAVASLSFDYYRYKVLDKQW